MKQDKQMVCYKKNRSIIYYASPNGSFHFVPNRQWKLYMSVRKQRPIRSEIFNTELEAHIAAIEYADEVANYHLELNQTKDRISKGEPVTWQQPNLF